MRTRADRTRREDRASRRDITARVEGVQYRHLKRVANAMNRVSWCEGNTPQSVFKEFVWIAAAELLDDPRTLCEFIMEGISTGGDGDRADRLKELKAAFDEEFRI